MTRPDKSMSSAREASRVNAVNNSARWDGNTLVSDSVSLNFHLQRPQRDSPEVVHLG